MTDFTSYDAFDSYGSACRAMWEGLERSTCARKVFWQRSVTSTNDLAKEYLETHRKAEHLVSEPESLPILFVAESQTAGRGRGNHTWWSPEGGLYLAIIAARRNFGVASGDSVELSVMVARAVAYAVQSVLEKHTGAAQKRFPFDGDPDSSVFGAPNAIPARNRFHNVSVKHPNDVCLDGRKIAGILIESPTPELVVIGVGANLNSSVSDAPEEIQARFVSLADVCHAEIDPIEFTGFLFGELF